MVDRNDNSIRDRMGQRFDDGREDAQKDSHEASGAEGAETQGQDENVSTGKADASTETTGDAVGLTVSNVKKEWRAVNVYLPSETLGGRVDKEFARLNYECDWDIKKNRHYYPLVMTYGIDRVEEMDASEVKARVEGLDL